MRLDFECKEHGEVEKFYTSYKDRPEKELCDVCGQEMIIVWHTAPFAQPDNLWHGRYYNNLNKQFHSKSKLNEYLKRNNLTILEDGMKADIKRNAEHQEAKRYAETEKEIGRIVQEIGDI